MRRRPALAALLVSFLALAGCGRASYHAGLREGDAVLVGGSLADVIAKHGSPDAVVALSSGTFTLEYRKVDLEGFLPGRLVEKRATLAYLARREKTGEGARVIAGGTLHEAASSISGLGDATVPEAPALRSRPVASALAAGAVLLALLLGTLLGPRRPRGARRTVLAALALGALTCGTRRVGASAAGAVQPGSHVSEVVNQHGSPDEVVTLPGEAGTLLVYRSHERTDMLLLGTDRTSHTSYLVQNARVVSSSANVSDVSSQYYFFPFYELERAPRPQVAATVASTLVLAGLAFALGSRLTRPKARPAEGTPPPASPAPSP